MTLTSNRLRGNTRLQAAATNSPAMSAGETGEGVAVLQRALVEVGYALPLSTRQNGQTDGVFGDETFAKVKDFQVWEGLEDDGIVGKLTIEALDKILFESEAADTLFQFDIRGFGPPQNLPNGIRWNPSGYRAAVVRIISELMLWEVPRAVLGELRWKIPVRPYPRADVHNAHWDPNARVLRFTPGTFDPANPLFVAGDRPPGSRHDPKSSAFLNSRYTPAFLPGPTFLHELVHTMRDSIGRYFDDSEVVEPFQHPPFAVSGANKLIFETRHELNAIVICNTYLSEREPNGVFSIPRDRPLSRGRPMLLFRKDWDGRTSHMPLPAPELFAKNPTIIHFIRQLWREQPAMCERIARAKAPFNPIRDVRALLER